jgi:cytochrome c oxidase subunit II
MISPSSLRTRVRRGLTTLAVACLPFILGGWIYGPQSTFDTKGPVARAQLDVFYVTVWVTLVIFIIVSSVLAYATLKFKARNSADEHAAVPPQGHGNPLVELGLIGASVLALVFIAVPTLKNIWYTFDVPASEQARAYDINATGFQWWFKFDYPKEEIELPNGGGKAPLTTANELVIPVGRPVRIHLRTYDVIHSFWVPKLAGKVDMIPNRGNFLWLQADEAGYYWGQCAEFCGESHPVMRFRVIALNEPEFAQWLESQKLAARAATPAAPKAQFANYTFTPMQRNAPGYSAEFDAAPFNAWKKQQQAPAEEDTALIAQGRQLFASKTCVSCHVVRGHSPGGAAFAPDLTHVGSRTTIAGGLLENNPVNLHRWITDPNGVKPGNKMYVGIGGMSGYVRVENDKQVPHIQVSDTEARALVAYLLSLK